MVTFGPGHGLGLSFATNTTAPAPAPSGTPESGFYSVKLKNNTVCLLAQMGLQFNISYLSKSHNEVVRDVVNLDPSLTNSSGSCDANRATLVLTQDQRTILNFTFSLNSTTRKYHLSGLALSSFLTSLVSIDYQTLVVDANFSLNTFKLQIQPFQVTTEQFATAEECQMDQDQMLIPIIVGAALAGLVLIVLIAYLIGRKRSQAGYQTI
uniref:Lysosome-associated membrane glycoprotein 1 n=1 Tax=Cynoglossus semilaevis TaxID=244447 RepID=A0A3P8UEF4_CYNSE